MMRTLGILGATSLATTYSSPSPADEPTLLPCTTVIDCSPLRATTCALNRAAT